MEDEKEGRRRSVDDGEVEHEGDDEGDILSLVVEEIREEGIKGKKKVKGFTREGERIQLAEKFLQGLQRLSAERGKIVAELSNQLKEMKDTNRDLSITRRTGIMGGSNETMDRVGICWIRPLMKEFQTLLCLSLLMSLREIRLKEKAADLEEDVEGGHETRGGEKSFAVFKSSKLEEFFVRLWYSSCFHQLRHMRPGLMLELHLLSFGLLLFLAFLSAFLRSFNLFSPSSPKHRDINIIVIVIVIVIVVRLLDPCC